MPYRKLAAGEFYHIYNRGPDKGIIFREPCEYLYFLGKIKEYISRGGVQIIAYCLMPNHFHLLLKLIENEGITKFMMSLCKSYTQAINKKYKRTGTLFEGPYKSIHVDRDEYLWHLCRYIHLNPLKSGVVKDIGSWPYSNWLEFVKKRKGTLVSKEFLDNMLIDDYEKWVLDYYNAGDGDDNVIRK